MLIYAIDDEQNMLYLLHEAIREAAPEAEIRDFTLANRALDCIKKTGKVPDVVFTDHEMPGITGLELAARLKNISPETKLVFVTGYDYALEAYRLHVDGYITKPVEAERVQEELEHFFPLRCGRRLLKVQCFGVFEVFWQNRPVHFARRQTKELLAFLVDRRGALCSSEEFISTVWEDTEDIRNAKHRVWNLNADLRNSLKAIGMEDVLISAGHRFAVRMEMLDCDYYRYLSGEMAAGEAFRGEYMEQYSWAEATKGILVFRQSAP